MSKEKQIKEMEQIGSKLPCDREDCSKCLAMNRRCNDFLFAERLYNAGYRKQSEGEWKRIGGDLGYVEMECSVCGYTDVFDDDNEPHKFCPECGAKMKGGEE